MQTLKKPVIADSVYLAPGAIVRGDVTLKEDVNVWFHAVIRAETGSVRIGSKQPLATMLPFTAVP